MKCPRGRGTGICRMASVIGEVCVGVRLSMGIEAGRCIVFLIKMESRRYHYKLPPGGITIKILGAQIALAGLITINFSLETSITINFLGPPS